GGAPPAPPPAGRRPGAPRWARLLVWVGACVMVLSGTTLVGAAVLVDRYTGGVHQASLLGGSAAAANGRSLAGPVNLLLLGIDERANNKGDMRSDTIIILHIPASHDQAYLVSVPRDSYVPIPASARSGFGGGHDKITEAFYQGSRNGAGREGGAQLVGETLHRLTGITFHGAAIVDFGGFRRIIDALGGVRMCVDHEVSSIHMRLVDGEPMWNSEAAGRGAPVRYKRGCRDMEGWAALDFSRQRYGLPHGDYDRQRHQQQLVKNMAKKAMARGVATDVRKMDRLVRAAGRALTLDTGGVPVADFAFTLRGVAANDLVIVRTNAGTFHSGTVGQTSVEKLSDESLAMLHAVRDGTLAQWLVAHPHFVSPDR
ncbi:MAG TPA: LCP family protein, partial [Pilimelia sp.]|nr:LCP family protein [Pilimelia sp.]